MHIRKNVDLRNHSTMRLGGKAHYLAEAHHPGDIAKLVAWARERESPFLVIGIGSNIVWREEGFSGLIIVNDIKGRQILSRDSGGALVKIGSGEDWDKVVEWTVEQGWSGIEFLSLIPGVAGAAPVQNLGAYGGELSNVLVSVEAYDTSANAQVEIKNADCGFSYRNSRFKSADRGRYIITAIVLRLSTEPPEPPFYEALSEYFKSHPVDQYTSASVRQAVIAIRSAKMPDPKKIANNGSFFTNPFVDQLHFEKLQQKYPDIKGWPTRDGRVKLSAGWLLERAGFRGVHDPQTGMATTQAQALVLVNEHAKSTADLLAFKKKIVDRVQEMFGVTLEQEPELLP